MKTWITWSKRIALWFLAIAAWETLSRVSPWIPSAVHVLRLVGANLTDRQILSALAGSLQRMAIGFSAVFVLGIGAGMLLGRFRLLDEAFGTVAMALHAMPGAAWVPLAILLFGLNGKAVVFTILLGASGIVMVSTSTGIKEVPPLLLRAARTLGARGTTIFWHVVVPSAVPRVVDGLRLAWAFGWRALMAGELMIGTLRGMGEVLNRVAKQREMPQILAFMVIIAVISLGVDHLVFRRLERGVRARWGT
jgi:NitT/TauT family transport system permease protein